MIVRHHIRPNVGSQNPVRPPVGRPLPHCDNRIPQPSRATHERRVRRCRFGTWTVISRSGLSSHAHHSSGSSVYHIPRDGQMQHDAGCQIPQCTPDDLIPRQQKVTSSGVRNEAQTSRSHNPDRAESGVRSPASARWDS